MVIEGPIRGYKAFSKGLINSYDVSFEVGKGYHVDGDIKFGTTGNGFHFCKNMEDTLRYVNGIDEEIEICEVVGSGTIVEFEDDYYGYYDMYACSDLYIEKILTREEIMDMAHHMNEIGLHRLFMGYKLTKEELETLRKLIKPYQKHLEKTISYFQLGDKDVYNR